MGDSLTAAKSSAWEAHQQRWRLPWGSTTASHIVYCLGLGSFKLRSDARAGLENSLDLADLGGNAQGLLLLHLWELRHLEVGRIAKSTSVPERVEPSLPATLWKHDRKGPTTGEDHHFSVNMTMSTRGCASGILSYLACRQTVPLPSRQHPSPAGQGRTGEPPYPGHGYLLRAVRDRFFFSFSRWSGTLIRHKAKPNRDNSIRHHKWHNGLG